MRAIRYHDQVKVLQGRDGDARNPFGRAEWFALLSGPGGLDPLVVETDALALPLTCDGPTARALKNWYSFTWQPLGDLGDIPGLARQMRDRIARVELSPLAAEGGTATALLEGFRAGGWQARLDPSDVNHVLPVQGRDFQTYLSQRPGRLRTTLKRKTSKVECEVLTIFQDDIWDHYERIYTESWKPEEGRPEMLRAFARQEAAAGRMRLGIASHDGAPIAAQFWTVEAGIAYIHKLAHLESTKPLSAGTVLTAALFRHVIDHDKVDLVDFGTGDDPYKRDWMEQVRTRYRLTAYDPRRPRNWAPIARQWARNLASRARNG